MEMIKATKIVRKRKICDFFLSFPMTEELFNAIALNVAKQDEVPQTDDELWNEIERRKKQYILGHEEKIYMGDVVITDYDVETQTVHMTNILADPRVTDLTLEQTPDNIIITTRYEGGCCVLTINKKDGSFSYIYT